MAVAAALLLASVVTGCAGARHSSDGPVAQQQSSAESARQRAKIHTELGMAYLASGQLTVALDEARIALNAESAYPLAFNLLGLAHMQMKEYARAEEYFEQALRLASNDSDINSSMGWLLCQTGREARSFAYFETAAKNPLYATPGRPLISAGQCALRIRDLRRAEDYLSSGLRLDPMVAEGHYLLADVMYQQNRYAEARLRLGEAHRLADPSAASSWLALRIERKTGDREGEARWIGQLRRKFADSPEHRLLTQGKFD